jgi:hypothetical protein
MTWHGHTSRTSHTQAHTTPASHPSPLPTTQGAADSGTGRNFGSGSSSGLLDLEPASTPAPATASAAETAATVAGGGAAVGGVVGVGGKEKHAALSWFSHRDLPVLIESLRAPIAALSASVYTYMYPNPHSKAAIAATATGGTGGATASGKVEGVAVEESEGGINITAAP